MQNQTVQLRVTLPAILQNHLQTKAGRLGLNMSSYVKNLIINDVRDVEYPVYQASKKMEQAYQAAKLDEKKGKLVRADDLKKFLNDL